MVGAFPVAGGYKQQGEGQQMTSQERWDRAFYDIAAAVAQNSTCLSVQIGAILVRDKSIIATGYNGPPRGVRHCDTRWTDPDPLDPIHKYMQQDTPLIGSCPRRPLGFMSGEGMHLCPAGHAEANCINNAAREGVITKGASMYMTCGIPCKNCLGAIINAGVAEIIVASGFVYDELTPYMIKNSGLVVRRYSVDVPERAHQVRRAA